VCARTCAREMQVWREAESVKRAVCCTKLHESVTIDAVLDKTSHMNESSSTYECAMSHNKNACAGEAVQNVMSHTSEWHVRAVMIRIPNIKQKKMSLSCIFSGFHFILNQFLENRNRNKFVPVTIESGTICDICDQNVTKPILLKKTKKQMYRFGHKFKYVTVCDRHKYHKLVTHSV